MSARFSVALTLAGLAIPVAYAQSPSPDVADLPRCAQFDLYRDRLTRERNQDPIGFGRDRNGRAVHLHFSAEGAWTILATRRDGTTCVLASGEEWRVLPIGKPS